MSLLIKQNNVSVLEKFCLALEIRFLNEQQNTDIKDGFVRETTLLLLMA